RDDLVTGVQTCALPILRVLERQAETEDGPAAVSLWNKIGELYRDRLNKADRAQKAFEKALSIDAQNLVAAEALIPLYEKGKDVRDRKSTRLNSSHQIIS